MFAIYVIYETKKNNKCHQLDEKTGMNENQ